MTNLIMFLVAQYSAVYNLDPHLVLAVMEHESSFRTDIIGEAGEIGLMQLLPDSFPGYSTKELQNPYVNIYLGVKHLSDVKNECRHQKDNTWIICYNLGSPKGNTVNHPKKFAYYKKVIPIYKRMKMFKVGQEVMILHAHVDGSDDKAVIVRKSRGFEPEGHYWVDFGYTNMSVEPSRIVSLETYKALQLEKNKNLATYVRIGK